MSDRTTIEIQGTKLDVDLRDAKQVNTLRVGDRCRLLKKSDYSPHKIHRGVVIGFEPFPTLPTVCVAYLEHEYASTELKFAYVNAASKDVELVASIDDDSAALDKADVLRNFEREIAKKHTEISELEQKRDYFLRMFRTYWEPVATADPAEEHPQ